MSRYWLLTAMGVAIVCLNGGCGSVGHDFKYQNADSLRLGLTRGTEYISLFGTPERMQVKETADGQFELVDYAYGSSSIGTFGVRFLQLEFREGILNSYYYMSCLEPDKTLVKVDRLNEIQRGISKKDDVQQILGKPHGLARCPSCRPAFKDMCGKGTEVWVWTQMNPPTVAARQGEIRSISVVFDKDGVVTDVESTTTRDM